MIPLPNDASPPDIEQWCTRGVVMVKHEDEFIPRWFHAYDTGKHQVLTTNLLPGVVKPTLMRTHPERVFVHWPRCGSVNLAKYAVHAERIAQRQYRRTWHANGLRITVPRGWDIGRALGVRGTVRWNAEELADACFSPRYYPYHEADELLSSGERLSVAITPRVIVAGDRSGKRMFYYNGQLAASGRNGMLYPSGEEGSVMKIAKLVEGRFYVTYSG